MGFSVGPVYIGLIKCPTCHREMIAVNFGRCCGMGHAYASKTTSWKPILLDREARVDMLNKLVETRYISQRNYKFAMADVLGKDNPAVKDLKGEAVAPPSGFKLFADSDEDSDVLAFGNALGQLFSGKKKVGKVSDGDSGDGSPDGGQQIEEGEQ